VHQCLILDACGSASPVVAGERQLMFGASGVEIAAIPAFREVAWAKPVPDRYLVGDGFRFQLSRPRHSAFVLRFTQ
jgi:hypothetical protein